MELDLAPEEIRRAQFRTVLRGLDASEVTEYLGRLAAAIETLVEQRDRLASRLGEYADRDLKSEFEDVGREVASVLQSAREASESMRERASVDAARWRAEAIDEAETLLKDARNDAEALRGDAWATGTELLNQTQALIRQMRQDAERDVLTVMGEAERDAHRLTSSARREAEELVRSAAMDSEKTAAQATKRHDEMIEQAHRAAESAQERTRALEERREELLEELEHARTTLNRLEGTLEERREGFNVIAEPSSSVRIVAPVARREPDAPPPRGTWQPGETVRIIQSDQRQAMADPEPLADEVAADVERMKQKGIESEPPAESEKGPEVEPDSEPVPDEAIESEAEPEPQPTSSEPPPTQRVSDDLGDLFAALRGGEGDADGGPDPGPKTVTEQTEAKPAPQPSPQTTPSPTDTDEGSVWMEERETRLLPITNRALRGVKKSVTEAQNIALDSLRTDDNWKPDGGMLAEAMRADLIGLWAESYSAGHTVAEEMTDSRLKRPDTPHSDAADGFGRALASAIDGALGGTGVTLRDRQSAASRVFRSWRTDEADRRIRELALRGYHLGLMDSVGTGGALEWVSNGVPCTACRDAASNPSANIPPIHAGCGCTLVAVS
ncbi:MAG: DivIVA domain-containing protein [Actinomycetota bacterium]|nr:DivIVA domain-containing protein [Actinomycetota bacterium]